jgi:hypothetical protein
MTIRSKISCRNTIGCEPPEMIVRVRWRQGSWQSVTCRKIWRQ